ncbi:VTT domain-containing protein [Patescibacteria group bacterium]|nr:VTT domain-containing protein [Patescibacteria group bacterium]MBU1500733.1 VTT domain-containing protein [Patescibacteria group bacterium]MBU2080788.1 VTT domain-containing protein [Patescibacteria group bacterium]MBU2123893.1 VTT domain-containing protein [Patescibacteria group bacterium]MBU2194816.1 VTT domain-containing protein [Patescibacteria group bacterium]
MEHLKAKVTEQLNVIGIAITIILLLALTIFVDIKELQELVATSGALAPLILIVLKASTIVVAPLSGSPLYPLVGLIFGFWPGILYIVAGDFLGITIAFTLSRVFGYPVVNRLIVGKERSTLAKIVRHVGTTKGFVHMCLTCFALPELIAYGAGLSTLPYWKFILLYLPISIAVSSAAVLFGSLLDPSQSSLFIAVGVPLAGAIIVGAGALLFLRGVRQKED